MARDRSSRKSHQNADAALAAFGANVRAILGQRGMTQVALAQGIRVKETTLNHWLTGAAMPSALGAAKIADFLGVSLDDLHGRDPRTAERMRQICDYADRIKALAEQAHPAPAKQGKTHRHGTGTRAMTTPVERPANRQ
jgi:transcriptional regulator with XRE-family HTH domain